MTRRLHVGLVGLRFGADFLPIYLRHPAVREVSIADSDPARLAQVGDAFGVRERHASLNGLLANPDIDAIHLLTPVPFHASQVVATLRAGKHCACAVPMATTLDDLQAIIAAQEASQRQYMMMETSVFAREYFYARELLDAGKLGELTFYRGFHLQDLDGFPPYWQAYPPMHYATHALSPALALTGAGVSVVRALGSGRLTEERRAGHANPFPLEAGLFQIRGHDIVADITMSFFQTARASTEGFSVYGTEAGIEWPALYDRPLHVHEFGEVRGDGRGREVRVREVVPRDRADLLPEEIADFTRPATIIPQPGLPPVRIDAWHGGSHPHLVHEFVDSILSGRKPLVDARTAAAWTAPGICAHESALNGGQPVDVPDFAA
jgi:predicted dehydrogenase